jgi:hypothetical protein
MDKTKLATLPRIRTECQFLFNGPFEVIPQINHRLFAVLALIDSGYTESQIISTLEGRISEDEITDLLAKIESQRYVNSDMAEDGQDWRMEFLGKRFLDSYLLVMKHGIKK